MPEQPNEFEGRAGPEASDADAQLRAFIRARQTPERLQEDWDRLRGAHRLRGSGDSTRVNVWEELKAALWLARVPQKVAWAAALVAALGAAWFALMPGAIRLRAPNGFQVAGITLPEQLQFQPARGSSRLGRGQTSLSGALGGFRSGAAGNVSVYEMRLQGTTTNGLPLVFTGSLVVTNAPGVAKAQRRSQVLGALLVGEIKVGDQTPVPVSQAFLP